MSLKRIVAILESTQIQNLEVIAKQIRAKSPDKYAQKFSYEIVRQIMENSRLPYEKFSSEYPYLIQVEGGILIGISPEIIIPDTRKNSIKNFAKNVKRDINGYDGLIQFLPFEMNGRQVRSNLETELNIAFVNLRYDQKGLNRRFHQYSSE
jgi:hypothetical protein